jgi:hypothetical protein
MLFAARWTSFPIFYPITYFHMFVKVSTQFFSLDSMVHVFHILLLSTHAYVYCQTLNYHPNDQHLHCQHMKKQHFTVTWSNLILY